MSGAELDDVQRRLHDARARLRACRDTVEELATALPDLAARAAAARRARSHAAAVRARERCDLALQQVQQSRHTALAAAQQQVSAAVTGLAPDRFGARWDDPGWHSTTPVRPSAGHLRVGELMVVSGESSPVILPLLGSSGWAVAADDTRFGNLVRGTVLRCFGALGAHRVAVTCYDPSMTVGLGVFGAVRQATPDALRPTVTTADGLAAEVARLAASTARVGDDLAGQGFMSLLDAWRVRGTPPHPFQIVVINGGLSEASEDTLAGLRLLLRIGAPRGVSVLLRLADGDRTRPDDLLEGAVTALTPLTITDDDASTTLLPGVQWRPDPAAPPTLILSVVDQALTAPQPQADTPDLADLLEELTGRWLEPGDEGVRALLGRSQERPLYLELRSENPPMPNALIGGAVGQGKSNLLLVLIHALAAQYAPSELEMVLLDFRDGVEFAPLGPRSEEPSWLPHAIVLGLESDRQFGLAVLEDMTAELSRRTTLFREAGVGKINDYRRRTGEALPRRLLIIDEFQRLLDGDDDVAERCAQLLDDLARTGRAAGFHLVLASQTVSGIRGLATRADAIFGQFHHRISLRNSPAESAAILAPHNTAAAELVHRGEVIVNNQFGDPTGNQHGVVAHADPAQLIRLRRELWLSAPPEQPPVIFRRSQYAEWTSAVRQLVTITSDGPALVPGAPISVRDIAHRHVVGRGGDQSVAVVGTDDALISATLAALAVSLVASTRAQWWVEILDGLSGVNQPSSLANRLATLLRDVGGRVSITTATEFNAKLHRLCRASEPALVLGLALDAVRGLDTPDPDTYQLPIEGLRELAQRGPDQDQLLVGWWRTRRAVEQHLGFDAPGVRAWGLCGVSRDDVETVCGPLIRPPEGSPRTLWHDRGTPAQPRVLVPFAWPDPHPSIRTAGPA